MRLSKRLKSAIGMRGRSKVQQVPVAGDGVLEIEDYSDIDLSSIKGVVSLAELTAYDGAEFVECCYRSFLRRAADGDGLALHMRMLANGASKIEVAYQLARSNEAHVKMTSGTLLARAVFEKRLAELVETVSADEGLREALDFAREQMHWSMPQPDSSVVPPQVAPPGAPPVVIRTAEAGATKAAVHDKGGFWLDMTTAFEWTGGVVGIVRAELEIAVGLNRCRPGVRFSMQVGNGFVEIPKAEIQWLLDADNVVDAYMTFFGRYESSDAKSQSIHLKVPAEQPFFHPYAEGDVVLSVGWMDSRKEVVFGRLKQVFPNIYLAYLIYDIILIKEETAQFYSEVHRDRFRTYIEWVSRNCDFILCGGETTLNDVAALQAAEGWPAPPARAIQFGTDIMKSDDPKAEAELLAGLGVVGPFIITVGSIEGRKNHDTLYRAYLLAMELSDGDLPQLIVCGRPYGSDDFVDILDRDPRIAGKVLRRRPTEAELAALYKHCLFTVLPSLYEGWSLTLPESLSQAKFCLCADNAPLREIGRDLVDYVAPFDVRGWAEKIIAYSSERDLLASREARIRKEWIPLSWQGSAIMVADKMAELMSAAGPPTRAVQNDPTIWMNLSLTFLQWQGGVTGVIRAELTYAYYLKKLASSTRFFAWQYDDAKPYFIEIQDSHLSWLFESTDISTSYKEFQASWAALEAAGTSYRNPFFGGQPIAGHPAYLPSFPDNSVIFSAGIDFWVTYTRDMLKLVDRERGVVTSQTFYDFTPFLLPQFHIPQTSAGYAPFFEFVSEHYDQIVYGGRTARRDGLAIQAENNWRSPVSDFIEFGADIALSNRTVAESTPEEDRAVLESLGITGKFIMTVGTIEPRKNHEMLYKAYLHILERDKLKEPLQMLFIGHKGWQSTDFLTMFNADERIKGKVMHLTPSDEQLDVLYRHCAFTLLASFYEGWSLTLPESLGYNKFCLVSDVDPLRETGGDLVEYVHPLDTYAWAERIEHYANSPAELKKRSAKIQRGWKAKTWEQSASDLISLLYEAHRKVIAQA